ncbi:cellulose biosynthesis protein BcsC [Izhakiella australiensis]|uniref:cellulose biosynthesis protein BcsC n=1 Tax=Izhakiella australiensis TaxID=1926881 RepID=UPI000BBDC180|nr:cellulose biosynthesis protein BcsC [Izhakiella australiensis]
MIKTLRLYQRTRQLNRALIITGSLLTTLSATAANNPAIQALLDQANYWHQKAHDDLARQSLQKVLMLEKDNHDALYMMALMAQQQGNNQEAGRWRERLAQASPQDSRLSELEYSRERQKIPETQLALARQQARSGNTSAALQTWRNLFSGEQPPAAVAAEYYLTMAGDRNLLPQAIDNLRQFAAAHPQDTGAQLALGKALTYQASTRREGLTLLENMADGNADADRALRQGLLWLAVQPGDAERYQRWQQRHPQDSEVSSYYQKNVGGQAISSGFNALNSGDVSSAQSAFNRALQANPQDADALAGLGYIAQRQGDFAQAAEYLDRAAKLGGNNSAQRQQQADDARFYAQLAKAQAALKAGDSATALSLSEPLTNAGGEKGLAVKLFRADVQRRSGSLQDAEQTYRSVLQSDPDNRNAKEGLFYVLRQQNRSAEANQLLASLPASVKASVAPRGSSSDPIRRQAKQAASAGNTQQAIAILQQGVQRYPEDGWLRLDLARLLQQQGDSQQAASIMEPTMGRGAGRDALTAGALFASETGAWQQAQTLINRIPAASRNAEQRALATRVNFNLQMAIARQYLAQGSNAAALNTLRALAVNPPKNPVDAGSLAQALVRAGDTSGAVAVARGNMQLGVQGNAGDYAAQVAVLNQAGLNDEAQRFLSDPALQARSTSTQLAGLRNGYIINQADSLREQGQYAAAYDKLITALQNDPQNRDLMFAMARLYQSGKMNKEAAVVYDYLMTRDTPEQAAREGAISVALARHDVDKARQLAAGLRGAQTPERLLLLAQVAEASGDKQQALAYLRSARSKAVGWQNVQSGQAPVIGGLALADNPFSNRHNSASASASSYGGVMPWQQAPRDDGAGQTAMNGGDAASGAQSRTLHQIDNMMDSLQDEAGNWVQGEFQVRGRDGESGLSKLTEAKAPLTWSSAPFGDTRFDFSLTPVTLSAGSASSDSMTRFGTASLLRGQIAQQNNVAPGLVKLDSAGSQNASGVEIGLGLSNSQFKVDLGSTPLGQDLSTLVGGIQWSPKLTDYLTLILTGERRAMADSLLSYVGVEDKLSGKRWGQVTKNGGSAMLSYDNGDAGFYLGGGGYSYIGSNVQSNQSLNASAGIYVRPYHDDDGEIKTGISIGWMDFAHNLSYFSYGQGGYFSPQNYVSVSLPVDFSRRYHDLDLRIGGSVGYQSYSQDRSAYFPTDPARQAQLEGYYNAGYIDEAYYPGNSKNGIGYNIHAGADYKVNRNVSIGGQLGYDTFGDYNESTARLNFRYLFGDH